MSKNNKNEYKAYAKYYDLIMQSGYYDHKEYAIGAQEALKPNSEILEIGVGSGLFAEQLVQLDNYNFTGIDFSPAMLELAKNRLSNVTSVKLVEGNMITYDFGKKFDYVISTGGPISISYRPTEQQHRLFSYSSSMDEYRQLLQKIYGFLKEDGLLLISIQEPHKDYTIELTETITHEQLVVFLEEHLQKTYIFKENGQETARQTIQTMYFDEKDFDLHFAEVGFKKVGTNSLKNYYIYQKQCFL